MIPRDPTHDDGPEPVPPAELLRLRGALAQPPSEGVRAQHLMAVTAAARQRPIAGPMGRVASRSARVAAAVVASLAITTGLAAAQVLPQPAQRLLSNVSDRFAPSHDAPPTTTTADPDPGPGSPEPGSEAPRDHGVSTPVTDAATTSTVGEPAAPVTIRPPATTTTIAGPTGPGSPTDPTDPEPTTTTTIDPGSTTTTTTDPGTSTTTTTEAPSP